MQRIHLAITLYRLAVRNPTRMSLSLTAISNWASLKVGVWCHNSPILLWVLVLSTLLGQTCRIDSLHQLPLLSLIQQLHYLASYPLVWSRSGSSSYLWLIVSTVKEAFNLWLPSFQSRRCCSSPYSLSLVSLLTVTYYATPPISSLLPLLTSLASSAHHSQVFMQASAPQSSILLSSTFQPIEILVFSSFLPNVCLSMRNDLGEPSAWLLYEQQCWSSSFWSKCTC